MVNSTPVVIASNQSAIAATIATLPSSIGATSPSASLPITSPRKQYISGLSAAPTTTYNNLLDGVSGSTPTDVRDYNTITIQILSLTTTGSYIFEGAWNSDFTTGGTISPLKSEELTVTTGASLINAAITPSVSTRIFRINISDINYFRIRLSTGYTSGALVADANLTQSQVSPAQIAVVQATGTNLNTAIASGTITTVSTVSSVTSSNTSIPGIIADVASAAIITTTTTATITPTFGASYQVNIPVTVVSGTTPTLDIQIQESADTGTNWYGVYDFPRITATGSYNSPILNLTGNKVRYVQTVSGTTPSFTRAINRLQSSAQDVTPYRQLIDRSISLTTLNSTTPNLFAQNTKSIQLTVNIGAASTPPVIQLQGSDDVGATFYNIGSPLTSVASSSVSLTVPGITAPFLRAIVSTPGVAVTPGYVLVRGF